MQLQAIRVTGKGHKGPFFLQFLWWVRSTLECVPTPQASPQCSTAFLGKRVVTVIWKTTGAEQGGFVLFWQHGGDIGMLAML